jgi:actin-related protein 6
MDRPALPPYESALSLTSSEIYLSTYPVTRAEYLEHGSSICRRRFGGPSYNVTPPGFTNGDAGGDISDDERERRYAMGIESKKEKGKRKVEEEEVTSGNWGGRRRRAAGLGI